MKKILFLSLFTLPFLGFSFSNSQLDQAIYWMYDNWLTKFSNEKDFMANQWLRRDEASKFFSQYAIWTLKQTPDAFSISCDFFEDINKSWPDLKDTVKQSCKLWLFWWYNRKFMPTQQLTKWQSITVLIRMLEWKKNETQWHFAQNYFKRAVELNILSWVNINNSNFDKLTTRWEVAILLFNISNLSWYIKTPEEIEKEKCNAFNIWSIEYKDCRAIKSNYIRKWISADAFHLINDKLRSLDKGHYSLQISNDSLWSYYCKETSISQECFWITDWIVGDSTTIYFR